MRFLEAFNEVLEFAISFRQEPRHNVLTARGIVSARWRIFDFLADFEFMKHVQPTQLAQRAVCASPSGGPGLGGRQARLTGAANSPAGRATPEPARAYRNLHLFRGVAVVQTVRQHYYLIACL